MGASNRAREAARSASTAVLHPPIVGDVWDDVRTGYAEELEPEERAALQSWLGFTGAFVTARAIAHAIKDKEGPFRNVSVGGVHLHHYMWGIGALALVGAAAIHGPDRWRRSTATAMVYGIGLGLIVDEFALLTDLEDVYWSQQGRISVEAGVSLIAVGGTALAAAPILRKVARRFSRGR
jgi:hypothetical protein